MSKWLCKKNDANISALFENFENIENGDQVYIYWDDFFSGGFKILFLLEKIDGSFIQSTNFESFSVDLPYTIFYKTKSSNRLIQLSENEEQFILNITCNNLINNQINRTDEEGTLSFENFLYNSHQ